MINYKNIAKQKIHAHLSQLNINSIEGYLLIASLSMTSMNMISVHFLTDLFNRLHEINTSQFNANSIVGYSLIASIRMTSVVKISVHFLTDIFNRLKGMNTS